jgi:uncharacterized protein YukE
VIQWPTWLILVTVLSAVIPVSAILTLAFFQGWTHPVDSWAAVLGVSALVGAAGAARRSPTPVSAGPGSVDEGSGEGHVSCGQSHQVNALQQFWVGDASAQFQDLSDTFAKSGSEMASALGSIAAMLSHAARVYDEGEQALKGKFAI